MMRDNNERICSINQVKMIGNQEQLAFVYRAGKI